MHHDRVGRALLVFLVLAHLEIARRHGVAHEALGVQLSEFQRAFVLLVVIAGPLVAAVGIWVRGSTGAIWVLLTSMFLALSFGLGYHYLIRSSDNVMCLPEGGSELRDQFTSSAAMLVLCEATTAVMSGLVLMSTSRERHGALGENSQG